MSGRRQDEFSRQEGLKSTMHEWDGDPEVDVNDDPEFDRDADLYDVELEIECPCGEAFVSRGEPIVCPKCGEQLALTDTSEAEEGEAESADTDDDTENSAEEIDAAWSLSDDDVDRTLWSYVGGAFLYPLRSDGLTTLLVGWVFATPFIYLSMLSVFGWLGCAVVSTYFLRLVFDVIVETADGQNRFPDWPDLSDEFHSFFGSLRHSCAAAVAAWWPLVPVNVALFATPMSLAWHIFFLLSGILLGLFFFGVSFLAVVLLGPLSAFRYPFLVRSILKSPGSYLLLFFIVSALALIAGGALIIGASLPWFLALVPLLWMYLGVVFARLLGLYYYTMRWRLNWFRIK